MKLSKINLLIFQDYTILRLLPFITNKVYNTIRKPMKMYVGKLKKPMNFVIQSLNNSQKVKVPKNVSFLKEQILQEQLQLTAENFLPIQKHSRILVSYKNLNQLDFKVYKLTKSQFDQFNGTHRENEKLKFIKELDVTTHWQSNLRDEKDYQNHTTEVLFPKLTMEFI